MATEKDGGRSQLPSRGQRDIWSRFFDESMWDPRAFWRDLRAAPFSPSAWAPRIDVSESDREVRVVAEVPGVDPDDIKIEVEDTWLRISGRTEREERSDEKPYRYERTYGEFLREMALPAHVKEDEVKATCKNGVLTVTLPKVEGEVRRKIPIERG